jgi:MinD superfamily P-loop ATPase
MAYVIDKELCTACGACQGECPVDAISEGTVYSIDADLCSDCGACSEVCPVEAISQA